MFLLYGVESVYVPSYIVSYNSLLFHRHSDVRSFSLMCAAVDLSRLVRVQYLGKEFTLWDRFEIDGEMTVGQFIDYFQASLPINF